MLMTNPNTLVFVTVTVSDGWNNNNKNNNNNNDDDDRGAGAQKCGQIDLGTGSYDVKIEGFHAAGEVKEMVTYR
jgi:hypothetical protein